MNQPSPIKRRVSRQIMVGKVPVGGDAPIAVQSMTNTETCDVEATVGQVNAIADAGADIVRVSVPSMEAAEAFKAIRAQVSVPLVADIHFDLHSIPLEDNQFDVIFCNHVLEHVTDDRQCLRELHRVMAPGGWGIFQVPHLPDQDVTDEDPSITDPRERERRFGQYDHVRAYGPDYAERLKEAGFQVETLVMSETLPSEDVERYRLPVGEPLFVASKVKA